MPRFFNTAGPCNPADHYMLPPLRRLPNLRGFIDRKQYMVLHAARQVGKTTAILELAHELTAEGRYAAVCVSAEQGQAFANDIGAAELVVLSDVQRSADDLPESLRPPPWPTAPPGERISSALTAWAKACPRPLVVFIDEIDALRDNVLISVLRQLRTGYRQRPERFPWSVTLVGLRDVRDYEIDDGEGRLGTASPFNIKVESLTMADFTRDDVAELYSQHTTETGQVFEVDAIDRAFELTRGQPWLVNALAAQAVDRLRPDPRESITKEVIDAAARALIERQDTHLDSLSKRLREPRIRALVEPMLAGESLGDIPRDDLRFAVDIGLLRVSEAGGLVVANPIYKEVIVRELATGPRASLPQIAPTWLDARGQLDPQALALAFLEFWRQHGDAMLRSAPYHEVAAQLVLMAFLHRVVNSLHAVESVSECSASPPRSDTLAALGPQGPTRRLSGGWIEREYAIGRGRMDLCLHLGEVTLAMELKVWRDGAADPLEQGLVQLDRYLDGLGLSSGWLVIFDQRQGAGTAAVRSRQELARSPAGREITLLRV